MSGTPPAGKPKFVGEPSYTWNVGIARLTVRQQS
jgi:hypothetical protein